MKYTYIEKLERFVTVEVDNPDNLNGEDLEAIAMPVIWEHIALNSWDDENVFESSIETE